ncbi:Alanine racemase TOXG [Tolypocladium ophioglossoides CBS 100239]|uniref:Alanine racemase TOXG n=1 Tax=Tolypocladium ophioglossoides (strain CBS 100239) TaxID=1163406 RepID=A0A0L0MZ00_TOLOC|nr:Alanine racemase TOXG [Tolypocladium ophioglossoides CBS 100239]
MAQSPNSEVLESEMKDTKPPIFWGDPARTGAASDFRSDVVTTPSLAMLAAIANATLHDDVYCEDETTSTFERDMASLCGRESAAFVISGTMANQLAVRSLLDQPPYAVLADAHAHIVHWEAGGVAHLSGAMVQSIRPLNGRYLTVLDAIKHAVITDDVHKAPTRVISIENTTSGTVIPLTELQRLKKWATKNRVAVHMDGARLWEAVAASGNTVKEFAQCCDVLTLDFSKNLGAPMGAMVVGTASLIRRLKRIRKSIGGGMRQAGVLAAAAQQAVLENFPNGQVDTKGILKSSHKLAKRVELMWTEKGGKLLRAVETNMVWLDFGGSGVDTKKWNEAGKRHRIKLDGKRIVLHHQICEEAILRLGAVMDEFLMATAKMPKSTKDERKSLLLARL